MDVTWIHHYTPDSCEGLKKWLKPGESAPKLSNMQQSAVRVMASVFWDAHGVIFIDYLEKERAITGAYCAALLKRLVDEIGKKRLYSKEKNILFHDNNAPSHASNNAQAKKHEVCFESLPHLLYSPDLAPSDYYMFPNPKRWLCSGRFESKEEVEWEVEGYFGEFDKSYYFKGIEKLKDRWTRIPLKGKYIEK